MGVLIMRFFVLGTIPGTNITITYWQVGALLVVGTLLVLSFKLRRYAKRKIQVIDPFHRAPKGMTVVELTAL